MKRVTHISAYAITIGFNIILLNVDSIGESFTVFAKYEIKNRIGARTDDSDFFWLIYL
jgi:hypothetical protein